MVPEKPLRYKIVCRYEGGPRSSGGVGYGDVETWPPTEITIQLCESLLQTVGKQSVIKIKDGLYIPIGRILDFSIYATGDYEL